MSARSAAAQDLGATPAERHRHESAAEAPRIVRFIAVKRTGPRLLSPYGHWWVEVDRKTSYGWWPDKPLRLRHWLTGTGGCLNGTWLNPRATASRDALHRVPADHKFHPVLTVAKTDDELRCDVAEFAARYRGHWGWQWPWARRRAQNCRTFQLELFEAVGLADPPGMEHTRGSGCPFLYPARSAVWAVVDAVARPPRVGKAAGAPAGHVPVPGSAVHLEAPIES